MNLEQTGILAPLPEQARYLTFELAAPEAVRDSLLALRDIVDGERAVLGIGPSLARALGADIPGLRVLPPQACDGFDIPSTPAALWCWIRGEDRGRIFHYSRSIVEALADAFRLTQSVDGYKYAEGRDLSGYIDGTENPQGDHARTVALADDTVPGLAGSSFVAVQLWEHDFDQLEAYSRVERDDMIGRRYSDNEELDDAPPSAHVKRTAQESFEPEAFMLRRSMPWSEGDAGGFMFVAFGHTLDAFEASLHRMSGAEDGIADGLFRFTRPRTGAYYWCPPIRDGRLDLSLFGL
ncbi:Dyp-type peroxidase [Acidihalobacter ferrooxydans]|uniref:Peroxidase n=1 Tax=Acidihalobacter ferrooxydans TaxID=1765967 RepID=A0A1P8UDB9_9GAMM|nr:Dyp-type peroxidase [Acidihalobacter ferrooxydans]APZ41857.1 peroxidase [Acidihalobacter ferrooxydans]